MLLALHVAYLVEPAICWQISDKYNGHKMLLLQRSFLLDAIKRDTDLCNVFY